MRNMKSINRPSEYASSADFERIFQEEMNSLYLLSFLLTADKTLAEQCFVSGLEDAVNGNPVFKEWAHSWSERVIIQSAVRAMKPQSNDETVESRSNADDRENLSVPHRFFAAILDLDTFARFVYVITVLEHYSDQECSALLGCARRDVLPARIRALQHVGSGITKLNNSGADGSPEKTKLRDVASSAIGWLIIPPWQLRRNHTPLFQDEDGNANISQ